MLISTKPTTDPQEKIRSAMEQILAAMCCYPDRLQVRLLPSHRKPILVVSCARTDYGAILGKKRSMLIALQLLTCVVAHKHGMEMELILDKIDWHEEVAEIRHPDRDGWDADAFEKLITLFCSELFHSCSVAIEPAASSVVKVTILVRDAFLRFLPSDVEEKIRTVFNCVGAVKGRRVLVELLQE